MELTNNPPCRKRNGKQISFEFKIFVISQINNGQISLNYASKKYNISRSTIDYWRKKISNYTSKTKAMGLQEENKKLKIGRDALFTLLRNNGLLVKKTKRFHITTDSKHYFYKSPNLLKNIDITHVEQDLVTDITYIKTDQGHAYLALATDPYSKKIMGYAIEDNMKVTMVKNALKMARKNSIFNIKDTIHHSDRGIQYCCPDYSEFAENMGFVLSTTQQYDPYELQSNHEYHKSNKK